MNQKTLRTSSSYIDKVLHTRPDNLIGYWPLNETSGNIAYDYSGNNNYGIIYNCELGCPGISGRSFYFNGVNCYINLISNLVTKFNGNEGTLVSWLLDLGNDTEVRYGSIFRDTLGKAITTSIYAGSIASLSGSTTHANPSKRSNNVWYCAAVSWSKTNNRFRCFQDGYIYKKTTYSETFTSSLAWARIGARTANWWYGNISHVSLWNTALSDEELLNLSVI